MSTQWYENCFEGTFIEVWDRCTPPELTKAEADFLVDVLQCKPGGRILDIPCGSGRHSRELSSRGYKVTGMDISRGYIERAKAQDTSVEWVCADMRGLSREKEFDAAFCCGNSFGYLEHEDTTKFLAALSRALKPGARFLLQTGPAEVILPCFREREWFEIGDIIFAEVNRYCAERSCVETTFTIIRDGKVETRPGRQYVYTIAEIQRMLGQAGLNTTAVYGALDKKPFDLAAKGYAYFLAEKTTSSAAGPA